MAYQVVMPQLGMTMTEGSVLKWLKSPGDPIEKGEPLFEVQTDKVEMEVEAPCSGVLAQIIVPVEQVVPVGTTLATIATGDGDGAAAVGRQPARGGEGGQPLPPPGVTGAGSSGAVQTPTAPPAKDPAPPSGRGGRRISPRARRIADERGVDLAALTAWKSRGRIVEADVLAFLARGTETPGAAPSPSSRVRQAIAARMSDSFREVPHFYLSACADATELTRLRQQLLPVIEESAGIRLSYLDLLIRVSALALRRCPEVNAYWDGSRGVPQSGIHVGFAAQFGDRLLTPVIRDAADLPLAELARARAALVDRGRSGKLTPRDLEEATFTVSNLGPFGVDQFQAIVVSPQTAILAVGKIAARPTVVDRALQVRDTVWLTVSVDHRILDGAAAARFLRTLVSLVESPYRLLLGER